MRKTLGTYFIFLFYLEIIFHLVCFKEINIFNIFILFSLSLSFSVLLTFITSLLKNEKINSIIMKTLCLLISIIFCAQLVYYQIYESFFSINGLFFAVAVKDGYDKVLLTIFQNIITIIFLLLPTILIFLKLPKKIEFLNKIESLVDQIEQENLQEH